MKLFEKINEANFLIDEKKIDAFSFDFTVIKLFAKDNKNILRAEILNYFFAHVSSFANKSLFSVFGEKINFTKNDYFYKDLGKEFVISSLKKYYNLSKRDLILYRNIIDKILKNRNLLYEFFIKFGAPVSLFKLYKFDIDNKFLSAPNIGLKRWL